MIGRVLTLILLTSFVIRTVRVLFLHIDLWQRKEYRFDRMKSHLVTEQGKWFLFHPLGIAKWSLFCLYPFFALFSLNFFFLLLVALSFFAESMLSWKVPQLRVRTGVVFLISLATVIFLLPSLPLFLPLSLLVLALATPFLVGGLFILSKIPFAIYERMVIARARQRLIEVRPIIVGITGSYGKTSTKEFLYHILKGEVEVAKTEKSQNAPIGIAQVTLRDVTKETRVFIAEMGAYRRGEILACCRLAQPTIAIVTGINEQHLEFFGSLANTMKTKYEIVDNLAPNGVAIFNGNNGYCVKLAWWAKKASKKVIVYQIRKRASSYKGFFATSISAGKDGVEFNLHLDGLATKVRAPVLGIKQVENILAAATVASHLGINPAKIARRLSTLPMVAKTMELVRVSSPAIIDDSFNSNPEAVRAVLDYMRLYRGQKILVLTPLIELGKQAERIHQQLGEEVGGVCDGVVLTNRSYYQAFYGGFAKTKKSGASLMVAAGRLTLPFLTKGDNNDSVIVFEGREAGRVLENLKTQIASTSP